MKIHGTASDSKERFDFTIEEYVAADMFFL
jgi:hypothetical protein